MIDPENPHSPVNSFTLDFIGIGFQGGAEAVLNEVARQHPGIELDINLVDLRERWVEKQADEARFMSFNKYNDGALVVSHAWAYRLIAYLFQDHMDTIEAERYVAQEIDITPALTSGMKRIVIYVMRGWFYDRVKGLIKAEADKMAAAAKEK